MDAHTSLGDRARPIGRISSERPSAAAECYGMRAHPTLDRESFQNLLATAFVVQESLMDAESRSAVIELLPLIIGGELDVNGAVHLIADRARKVANATGIAIGLLEGDQLVYRAGSGSTASYVGRHVLATLSVSAKTQTTGEILRVEDAQTDARIGAAICRQFGATSLLILPIYKDRVLAGILGVFFSDAHAFQDREVCTYQLMARAVGEAMSCAVQHDQKRAPSRGASPVRATTMIKYRTKRVPSHIHMWKVADRAAVVIVVVMASWIAYSYRRSALLPTQQKSNAIKQQVPLVPTKLVQDMSKPHVPMDDAREAGRMSL
jgi:hypothetical protein